MQIQSGFHACRDDRDDDVAVDIAHNISRGTSRVAGLVGF